MIRPLKIALMASALAVCACSKPATPPAETAAAPAPAAAGEVVRLDPAFDALVAPGARIEKVATGFKFTEGPMWRDGRLWFSDLVGDKLAAVSPDGAVQVLLENSGGYKDPPPGAYLGSNGLATDKDGFVLMAQHGARRIVRLDDKLAMSPVVERFEGKRLNSPNDLVFAPDGALWFSDPPFGLAGQDRDPAKEVAFNGVYRLADGKLTAMIRDLPRPNGLGFSPDGRTLYVSNTAPMFVKAYAVGADGKLDAGKTFAEFSEADGKGAPDGLKIDSAGDLWTTGPAGIYVFAPTGKLLGQLKMPETVANLAWTDDGRTLYMTGSTSIYRLSVAKPGAMPLYRK